MKNEMTKRGQAEKEYKLALRAERAAALGSNEQAYIDASMKLDLARSAMVAAQISAPTRAEVAAVWRDSRTSWMR